MTAVEAFAGRKAQAAVDDITAADLDRQIADAAEHEAEAQLAIIRALKPLGREGRELVLQAVTHLLEAERLIPGVLEAFTRGQKR